MGGKSKSDNSQVVNQQQQEAAQEAAKEAARQQRLQTGLTSIKQAFEGSPVMATQSTPYDWSKLTPGFGITPASGAPAGYTAVKVPTATTAAAQPAGAAATGRPGFTPSRQQQQMLDDAAQQQGRTLTATQMDGTPVYSGGTGGAAGGSTWGLQDASGKIYKPGDALNLTSQVDTGQRSGGFDDAFYNKYKQSVLDYYMPQVDEQYKKATDQATYGLGRSGNLRSSAANTLVADLAKQNDINQAGVRNQADTAAGDLRSQVSTEEQKATSQLYATEDPEVAANQATAAVRDISLKQPDLSPLSALFNVASIGGANIYKGYQGQQKLNAFNSALSGTAATDRSRVVGGA